MNTRTLAAVYRKEMLELFRDRRTMISMVVVPLVLFPLLFAAMSKFMKAQSDAAQNAAVIVGVSSEQSLGGAAAALKAAGVQLVTTRNLRQAVEQKQVSAALRVINRPDGSVQFQILADQTRDTSKAAGAKVDAALQAYKSSVVAAKLRGLGVPESTLSAVAIQSVNIASNEKMGSFILGGMAGYLMLLLMFTGAMYPAIDTGAGEKERHTLEALLASPASRLEIIIGKIAACATASFLTAFLSLVSFLYFGKNALASLAQSNMRFSVGLPTAALALGSVIPIAILAASAMVAISLLAKSYKEGQSYIMPLLMCVIFPIVLGTFTNLELTPAIALIPVFNTALAMKQIFTGSITVVSFSLALILNLLYAAVLTAVAVRVFSNEKALFRT